jgi:hypothetical protein
MRDRLVGVWAYGTLVASLPVQVMLGVLAVVWTRAEAWRRSL